MFFEEFLHGLVAFLEIIDKLSVDIKGLGLER